MRIRLGNIANALCLILCALTLLLWKTEPHWFAMGWTGEREFEVHVADSYIELVTAHHMTNNAFAHAPAGQWFAFHRPSSAWGNPVMAEWDGSSTAHIGERFWFGHGTNKPDARGEVPSSRWVAIDSWMLSIMIMVWPMLWVLLRMRRRQLQRRKQAASAA
jgi:hypothetical protein